MSIYYIEMRIDETNSWQMVGIENDESLAIDYVQKLRNANVNRSYRVVKYVDYLATNIMGVTS